MSAGQCIDQTTIQVVTRANHRSFHNTGGIFMGDCRHSWIVRHSFKAAFIVSCVAGLLFAAVVSGRAPDVPKLSVEDIIGMRKLLSAQISPDGRYVAYVVE